MSSSFAACVDTPHHCQWYHILLVDLSMSFSMAISDRDLDREMALWHGRGHGRAFAEKLLWNVMAVLSRLYSAKIHCNKADVCSAYKMASHTARNDG